MQEIIYDLIVQMSHSQKRIPCKIDIFSTGWFHGSLKERTVELLGKLNRTDSTLKSWLDGANHILNINVKLQKVQTENYISNSQQKRTLQALITSFDCLPQNKQILKHEVKN